MQRGGIGQLANVAELLLSTLFSSDRQGERHCPTDSSQCFLVGKKKKKKERKKKNFRAYPGNIKRNACRMTDAKYFQQRNGHLHPGSLKVYNTMEKRSSSNHVEVRVRLIPRSRVPRTQNFRSSQLRAQNAFRLSLLGLQPDRI